MPDVKKSRTVLAFLLPGLAWMIPVNAATVPFVENYSTDVANWRNSVQAPLNWSSNGGPDDSSYALGTFNFINSLPGATPVLLRGHDVHDASNDAFVGDWISDGVTNLSTYVWHDAGVPLTFFARMVGSANFPGAVALDFVPVPSEQWTLLEFAIAPDSPQFITFEGSDFNTIFSAIGNVQFGVSVPAELAGVDAAYSFGLDQVSIVPEPATAVLGLFMVVTVLRRVRRTGGHHA